MAVTFSNILATTPMTAALIEQLIAHNKNVAEHLKLDTSATLYDVSREIGRDNELDHAYRRIASIVILSSDITPNVSSMWWTAKFHKLFAQELAKERNETTTHLLTA